MASMASIRPASIHSSRLGLRVVAEHDPSAIRQSVGTAEDQYLEELLEDHPIRYTGPMAAQRMIRFSLGQQGTELLPDGIDNVWLDRGHGHTPSSGSFENSPDDRVYRVRSANRGTASLLAQALYGQKSRLPIKWPDLGTL